MRRHQIPLSWHRQMPASPNQRSNNAERTCDGKRNHPYPQIQRAPLKPKASATITFNARKCPTIRIVLGQLPVERERQDPNGYCDNKSHCKCRRLTHKNSTKTIINAKHPTPAFSCGARSAFMLNRKYYLRKCYRAVSCKALLGSLWMDHAPHLRSCSEA
jgi:hypothetical protein